MADLKAHKGRFWIYLIGAVLTGALGWFLTLPLGDAGFVGGVAIPDQGRERR